MDTDRIRKKILLRAPIARVWRAISDSAEFGAWFGMRLEGPFVAGRTVRGVITSTTVDARIAEAQKPYQGLPVELRVEEVEPQRLFSFRWHPGAVEPGKDYSAEPTTLVAFELAEQADGVLLTITESGFDNIPLERRAKAFSSNENGWEAVLKMIEGYLAKTAKAAP
jgi:uncharacterized protein YndB with AHSA1/START domain